MTILIHKQRDGYWAAVHQHDLMVFLHLTGGLIGVSDEYLQAIEPILKLHNVTLEKK